MILMVCNEMISVTSWFMLRFDMWLICDRDDMMLIRFDWVHDMILIVWFDDLIELMLDWYNMIWYDVIWIDMIWYDMNDSDKNR